MCRAKLLSKVLARGGNFRHNDGFDAFCLQTQDHRQADRATANDEDDGVRADLRSRRERVPGYGERFDKRSSLELEAFREREYMCCIHADSLAQPAASPTESDETSNIANVLGAALTSRTMPTEDGRLYGTCLADFETCDPRADFFYDTRKLMAERDGDGFASNRVLIRGAEIWSTDIFV